MKTPSGTFALVVVAAIAVIVVLSCCEQQFKSRTKPNFVLVIGDKGSWVTPTKWVDLKNGDDDSDFRAALMTVKNSNGGGCEKLKYKSSSDTEKSYDCTQVSVGLSTDKVTRSQLAKSAPAGDSSAGDPNITYKVFSSDPNAIKAVLDTLK